MSVYLHRIGLLQPFVDLGGGGELLLDPDIDNVPPDEWIPYDFLASVDIDFSGEGVLVTDLGGDSGANIGAVFEAVSGTTYRFTGTIATFSVGPPVTSAVGFQPAGFGTFDGTSTTSTGPFSLDWTSDTTGPVIVGAEINLATGNSFRLSNTSVVAL